MIDEKFLKQAFIAGGGDPDDFEAWLYRQPGHPGEPLNLYLLKACKPVDYDSYSGFVVRAKNEPHARSFALDGNEVWENEDFWEAPAFSACQLLAENVTGKPGIVLDSYHAG